MTIAILGAGPAGMSCANALLSFGFDPVVIERTDQIGGIQRTNFHTNLWMLGMPGETGIGITERLSRHYFDLPIVTHLASQVLAVSGHASQFQIDMTGRDGRHTVSAQAIVLATGSRPRTTPELSRLACQSTRIIIGPLSETIRDGIGASQVLILGGGDNALDHALFLAERGNQVTVCTRKQFSARKQFLDACAKRNDIELRPGQQARILSADATHIGAECNGISTRYDWLLVMFGYAPNTEVRDSLAAEIRPELAPGGFIHVGRGQRTSVPGIYAAGDVTDCVQPSVPTAIAQGLTAARAIEQDISRPAGTQATQST